MLILQVFAGYLVLFGAGLLMKFYTGWDSGWCMTAILLAIPVLALLCGVVYKITKSFWGMMSFLYTFVGFACSRVRIE